MGDSAASEPVLALHSQLGSGSPMGESTHSEPQVVQFLPKRDSEFFSDRRTVEVNQPDGCGRL